LYACASAPLIALAVAQAPAVHAGAAGPSTLPSATFVPAPPGTDTGPDDITMMASPGVNSGHPVIWTAFQNGIGTRGEPGPNGDQSTVAGYDPTTGNLVETIPVTGKVDGLTANPALGQLMATVNEDGNSAFNLVNPQNGGSVTTYTYSPSPEVSGNGGTDSIAIQGGQIIVSHSNPNDTTQPTAFTVTLNTTGTSHTANLTPLFFNNSAATDAVSGAPVTLALTDPDTNYVMPSVSPRFGTQLATISQADGQIIFSTNTASSTPAGTTPPPPQLTSLHVTDNKSGNVPPIDGLAVATADAGTLYVVDGGSNQIKALNTSGWPAGTVFVSEPSDNSNPLVGTLNLSTGVITPLANTFTSPKGLLFVPAQGYLMTATDGGIFNFGTSQFFGSTGAMTLNKPIVGAAPNPDGGGYWLVASDGGIFSYGDATFFGSTGAMTLNKPIVGMAPTPDGRGYWLVASDGGIFSFGDATFFGSTGAMTLNKPVVGMAATPTGAGYWLVASDGGIFSFGDAKFFGSTGSIVLNKPVVGMAPSPSGAGYWLVASDGGIFGYGDAQFFGSTGAIHLNKPVVGMAPSPSGAGYWLVASDGGIFNYGDASFLGSMGAVTLNKPVVGMAATG
jgi:hypothetical protein